MYLNDIFTVTVNMAGLPGISVPAGRSKEGLPLGLQLIGKAFDEETVLQAGQVIEDAAGRYDAPEAWWANGAAPAKKTKDAAAKKPAKTKAKTSAKKS
jgi:aspartyl-tRNA(Asn)/glutamyl-tRNA(Gln) amidotransferase subunit A